MPTTEDLVELVQDIVEEGHYDMYSIHRVLLIMSGESKAARDLIDIALNLLDTEGECERLHCDLSNALRMVFS